MKSIIDYFSEAKFANSLKRNAKSGTPDGFTHNFKGHNINFTWDDESAHPFIYNKRKKLIAWGNPGNSHYDMISDMGNDEKIKMGLENIDKISQLRWDWFENYDNQSEVNKAIKLWNKRHPIANDFCLGRIWHENLGSKYITYLVWWNELTQLQFTRYSNYVINDYNNVIGKKLNEPKINDYYAIGNNGEFIEMDVNDNVSKKIKPRDNKTKNLIKQMRAIHLATQEEKRKYFELYRKQRNEYFQKLYDKTKSGTEAEWHNNKVKRYNSITGKMEWGDKIGDSLEIKSIKNYILETEID